MAQVIAWMPAERTNRLLLAAGGLFAAVAAVLVFVALQSQSDGADGDSVAATLPVVVTAQAVPANTVLTVDMLAVRALPEDAIVAGAYGQVEPLVGLPVRFPLAEGEQLTPAKVGLDVIADEDDLALVLPEGQRAVAVEVSEVTSVGGLLLPGNRVDVIAVFHESATGVEKAVTLVQDVEVLAVAQEAQVPVPAAEEALDQDDPAAAGTGIRGRRANDAERQPDARTVTLAVTPEQAQLLALAQANSTLWLSLRPFGDRTRESVGESNLVPFGAGGGP